MERIIGVAIELPSGEVPWLKEPYRHCDLLCDPKFARGVMSSGTQGFWTSEQRFVDRSEAYGIAVAAGQLLPQNRPGHTPTPGTLYSEDLW